MQYSRLLPLPLALAVIAAPVCAQDLSASPTSGEVSLGIGFTPDPYRITIIAGGSEDASDLGDGCIGKIAEAPDFRLHYTGGNVPLTIRAIGEIGSDTALVINEPDGSWTCDDDSYGDLDPSVTFSRPQSGQYDIWLADVNGDNSSTVLEITEIP